MATALRFAANWRLTAFTLLFLPILVSLGFWQLARANEKLELFSNWEQQQLTEPKFISEIDDTLQAHQRVLFRGRLLPQKYWLLEARIYKGRSGYEVLMPAEIYSATDSANDTGPSAYTGLGTFILINRGWLVADQDRRVLPRVDSSEMVQLFSGALRRPTETALVNERNNALEDWPHRILDMDMSLLAEQFGHPLSEYVVLLDQEHPEAFIVQGAASSVINMTPEKHRGYAFQWFCMAFSLGVLWVLANTNIVELLKRKNKV